jgi:transposase
MSDYTSKYLAQLAPGTLFAGVDLSLETLVVVVQDGHGKRLTRFHSANQPAGYADLRERLAHTAAKYQAPAVIVGMEPTNYYWKQLGYDLEQHQVPFYLVNALTVKRHREGDQLDRSKDDERDAQVIADLVRTGKVTQTHLPHGVYAELQSGYVALQRLRRDRGRQLILLINTVRQLFPELEQVFRDLTGLTVSAVLATGLSPAAIRQQSQAEFLAAVRATAIGQRLGWRQVRQVYAEASSSAGFYEATQALGRMAQQQSETIRLLDGQAAQLQTFLLGLLHTLPETPYLLSIEGFAAPSVLGVVAHTGDLRQYPKSACLVKLAGTAPTPNRSGRKTYSATPFSHQGRSGLRTVLYFATLRMLTRNAALGYQYQRLTTRAQHPLPKMQAVGACMNKLLHYCWQVVNHQEFYDPARWRSAR